MQELAPDSGPWGPRGGATGGSVPSIRVAPGPSLTPLVFRAARRAYAALNARGLALYLPTFGFNRFWLRTDQRRHLWLHTTLGGDSFEYRGTARELVVGFLFALAIYLPVAAAYSLAGLYAESVKAYASLPFVIFTFAFGHFAAFRARRYRLTRTGFRGLRFWMQGSGWMMGFGALFWYLLLIPTAGLAYPWMQAWLERYKMSRSHYGNLPGAFHGTGGQLFRALAVPAIIFVVLAGALVGLMLYAIASAYLIGGGGAAVSVVILLGLPLAIAALSVLNVIRTRWLINGARFGAVSAEARIRAGAMIWPAIKTLLLIVLAGGVWFAIGFVLAVGVLRFSRGDMLEWVATEYAGVIAATLWSLGFLVIAMFIKATVYNYEFFQRFAAATTISGLETLDAVSAAGTPEGVVGEGLADALGADGF